MTHVERLEDARRSALKELVRLAHGAAANFSEPNWNELPSPDELLVATQLRLFADLMDVVATKGSARTLALFFDGPAMM